MALPARLGKISKGAPIVPVHSLDGPFEALRLRAPTRTPRDLPQKAKIIWKAHESFGLTLPFASVRFQVKERSSPNGDSVYVAYRRDKRTRSLAVTSSMLGVEEDGKDPLDFARFRLESPPECDPDLEPNVRTIRYLRATFPMFHLHPVVGDAPLLRRIAGFDPRASTGPRLRMERLYLDEINTAFHCVDYEGKDPTGTNILLKPLDEGGWALMSSRVDADNIDVDGRWVLEVYKHEARLPQLNAWLALCCAHAAEARLVEMHGNKANDKGATTGAAATTDDELDDELDNSDTTDTGSENSSNSRLARRPVRNVSIGPKLYDGEPIDRNRESTQNQELDRDAGLAGQQTVRRGLVLTELPDVDTLETGIEESDNSRSDGIAAVAVEPGADKEPVPDLDQSRASETSVSYDTDFDTPEVETPRSPSKSTEQPSPETYND